MVDVVIGITQLLFIYSVRYSCVKRAVLLELSANVNSTDHQAGHSDSAWPNPTSLLQLQTLLRMQRLSSTMASNAAKCFAPLRAAAGGANSPPKLQGIVFDMDGTLW